MITVMAIPLAEWGADADRAALTSHHDKAMRHFAAGRPAKAIPLFKRALAECERTFGRDHPNTLRSRNNLGMCYRAAGLPAEALPLLERAVADCTRVLGPDHPDTKVARENLAALTAAGKPAS